MNRYVISDIHGDLDAFEKCLNLCNFDFENDFLIILGDICDRGLKTKECVDLILTIKNKVFITGNHDDWFIRFLNNKLKDKSSWIEQGGLETIYSYQNSENIFNISDEHREFWNSSVPYYLIDNMLFVHGGYNPKLGDIENTIKSFGIDELYWDRDLTFNMMNISKLIQQEIIYDKVFVGHTPTVNFNSIEPIIKNKYVNIDTGNCYGHYLTIMNIDTLNYYKANATILKFIKRHFE